MNLNLALESRKQEDSAHELFPRSWRRRLQGCDWESRRSRWLLLESRSRRRLVSGLDARNRVRLMSKVLQV